MVMVWNQDGIESFGSEMCYKGMLDHVHSFFKKKLDAMETEKNQLLERIAEKQKENTLLREYISHLESRVSHPLEPHLLKKYKGYT
jgi:predicted nuclease with TOPRIM domain